MQKITFQGALGAYSHIACTELFPGADYIPCDTFEQAMELVSNGEADFAVIPVENSNAGRVSDVHFLLPKTGLTIVGEHFLRVEHQLLALPGAKLEDIEAAASHPQALAQCSEFLKKHSIKALSRIDTAKSCERIIEMQDKTRAAIASKLPCLVASKKSGIVSVRRSPGIKRIAAFRSSIKNAPTAEKVLLSPSLYSTSNLTRQHGLLSSHSSNGL